MTRVKRYLALMLAVVFALTFIGCSNNNNAQTSPSPSAPATQTADASAPAATDGAEATPAGDAADDGYSSLDDFVLYDENNVLTKTGRDATGTKGVVASGKYEASKIGVKILENGGNAVDAAVAVGFALGLAEPNSSGIGGGGFMTLHDGKTGETVFIDFREKAPSAATPEMWQTITDEEGKETVIGDQKTLGGKSAGIPGEVAGLTYALENYGTMELKDVLQPVIELANNGLTVSPTLSSDMKNNYDTMMLYSEAGDLFLKDVDGMKVPYEVGEVFKNPEYAKTMQLLADKGPDVFYKGEIAEAIVASINKYGGLFTMEDMANYEVEVMEPIKGTYRGYEVISSPPPSSGGAVLIEILNILENFNLNEMEDNSAEELHLIAEAFKLAYADRGEYMGDTRFVDVPLSGMTSKEYAKKLAGKISTDSSIENPMPDDPWMFEHEDTTHFSVADSEGNIVAVTQTVNYVFGNKVVVDGYGFVMNDEMDDFVTGPDHPNSIAGGKTPLSSMTPTILLKDGKPFAVLGSPGGTTIISTVAQVVSNLVDHDMTMQEAIDAPRIKGFRDNKIDYETRIDAAVIEELTKLGHECGETDEWDRSFGSVNAVRYSEDGKLDGGGDPRRDGKALGF